VSGGALGLWQRLVQPFVKHRVPFAVTFGNHDIETDLTKREVLAFLRTVPYSLTFNADEEIDGVGNCYFPVLGSSGTVAKWYLYALDSHAYPEDKRFGAYDWVKPNQVQWYRQQRDELIRRTGSALPSLAFFHIPTPEYATVRAD